MFGILVSATFAAQLRGLSKDAQRRIRAGLEELRVDPRTPRPRADIKPLKATDPPKHRLRIDPHRVLFIIEGRKVKLIEVFARERGYRE